MTKDIKTVESVFGKIKPKQNYSSSTMTIIMGKPGTGKTVLATTASQVGMTLLVNFENRVSHINETENLRIVPNSNGEFRQDRRCTYLEFDKLVKYLEGNNLGIRYLIIDTIDEMFITISNGMLNEGEITSEYMGAKFVYRKMNEYFKRLKDIGCSIICTSHVRDDFNAGKLTIALTDKLRNGVNAQVDNIFYMTTSDNNRTLQLKSSDNVECKLSVNPDIHDSIPKELLNSNWKEVEKTLYCERG